MNYDALLPWLLIPCLFGHLMVVLGLPWTLRNQTNWWRKTVFYLGYLLIVVTGLFGLALNPEGTAPGWWAAWCVMIFITVYEYFCIYGNKQPDITDLDIFVGIVGVCAMSSAGPLLGYQLYLSY